MTEWNSYVSTDAPFSLTSMPGLPTNVAGNVTIIPTGIGGLTSAGEVVEVPRNLELVSAAGTWTGVGPYNLQVLAGEINSHQEKLTSFVVEAMLDDPAVFSSFETLKVAVLAADLNVHPAFEENPEGEDPPPGDPAEARRAADFCRQALKRLSVPFEVWARDALDALAYGHKVAELVMEYITLGDADGYYTLGALKMKPRWTYHLCTDPFFNLICLYCQTVQGPAYIDRDHFVVFSWDVKDNDPRGSSRFRAAKDPWRRKIRAKDSRSKGDDQFGTPSLAHELPPNTLTESQDPITKQPTPTTTVINNQLKTFSNGGCFTYFSGGDLKVIESQRDGKQIGNSIDYYDRDITRAIVLQDKATMNPEHYTQGGADVGQDIMADDVAGIKRWICSIVQRQVLHRLLTANEGEEYANLYTPLVTLGAIELRKFHELATPIAVLMQAGGLTPSQISKFFAMFGLPVPMPGELRIGPSGPIPNELPQEPVEPTKSDAIASKEAA